MNRGMSLGVPSKDTVTCTGGPAVGLAGAVFTLAGTPAWQPSTLKSTAAVPSAPATTRPCRRRLRREIRGAVVWHGFTVARISSSRRVLAFGVMVRCC
jgi:hypothetical protein